MKGSQQKISRRTCAQRGRRVVRKLWMLTGLVVLIIVMCDAWVQVRTVGLVYDQLEAIPPHDVALVLGTSKRVRGGQPNRYFHSRMEAAARLYHAGKVRHVLVSGSNPSQSYNEANDMRKALIALDVPAEAITRDYAGFRTLDSMIRCKEVFKQDSVIVVSQVAHNRRAIFLARSCGLDAVGYNADDIRYWGLSRQRIRESFARCKALLDVYLLRKGPKFLGDPVPIPLDD